MTPINPRAAVEAAARELLLALAACPVPPTARVADADGRAVCLIQVWPAARAMPTVAERRRPTGRRAGCKADILAAVRAAGEPLTRKDVARALRLAGKDHGPGTEAKALADLTAAGELVNQRDKKGYRLAERWRRSDGPTLFD